MTDTGQDLQGFYGRFEQEARRLPGLKELEIWYRSRLKDAWKPVNDEVQLLVRKGESVTMEQRAEIARRLGVTQEAQALLKVYGTMVAEFMERIAEDLTNPDSAIHRQVIDKYDAAWKELARR